MKHSSNYICGIIGAGKVASALARELSIRHFLKWVLARSGESVNRIKYNITEDVNIIRSIDEITDLPNIIIIVVSDNSIKQVSEQLSKIFKKDLKDKYILHTSGSRTIDELSACRDAGAKTAAAHPYQTFYHLTTDIINGAGWGIECNDEDKELLGEFIQITGGKPHFIEKNNPAKKQLYHASAVTASNFFNTIFSLAVKTARDSGIEPAEFIPHITLTTFENNIRSLYKNEKMPLTGPFARGDIESVRHHLEAMKDSEEILKPYIMLSKATVELAYSEGFIDRETYEGFMELFDKYA